jgi:hypothetical protein
MTNAAIIAIENISNIFVGEIAYLSWFRSISICVDLIIVFIVRPLMRLEAAR